MQQPQIFIERKGGKESLERFTETCSPRVTLDVYRKQLEELFEIMHPAALDDSKTKADFIKSCIDERFSSAWVFLPWRSTLVHCLARDEYTQLLTNRNQLLVTKSEQARLLDTCIAYCGLSVGNAMALSALHSGIATNFKLADFDTIETANLNRVRASVLDVGQPKVELTARQLWEANPFINLQLFSRGIDEQNITSFFEDPVPKIVFEAIDDFKMKIRLRQEAKSRGIPVVMLTSLGDNLLMDIERYDIDESLPLFNGLLGDLPEDILQSNISHKEQVRYAIDIVGMENIPTRALESLLEMRKSLVGRPQLASTVMINGGIGAYIARQILLGGKLESGRYSFSVNDIFKIIPEPARLDRDIVLSKLSDLFEKQ